MGRRGTRAPLGRLGELLRNSASRPPAPPQRQAATDPCADDLALFRRAVEGAQPIAPVRRIEAPYARAPSMPVRPRPDDQAAPEARRSGLEDRNLPFDGADDAAYLRPGMGPDVLRKLRRLQWPIEAELSVRRLTRDEAREALAVFLSECLDRGLRCVRVVHGKGMQSPNGEPVLKGLVKAWLAGTDEVLGFCHAPPAVGGGGALIVLLKTGA